VSRARLADDWNTFWYRPGSPTGLVAMRTIVVLNALWILLSRPDLPTILEWPREFWSGVDRLTALRHLLVGLPMGVEWSLFVLLHVALGAALFGVLARPACLTAGLLLYHFAPLETILWSRLGPYFQGLTLPTLALLVLAIAPRPRLGSGWSPEYRWPLALVQVLFAFNYVSAAFSKLHTAGWGWISAENIQGMVRSSMAWSVTHPVATDLILGSDLVAWTIAAVTMVVELLFFLVPFSRPLARVFVPLAAAGHLGITLALGIVFLSLPVLALYVDWDAVDEALRHRVAQLRARVTGGAGYRA